MGKTKNKYNRVHTNKTHANATPKAKKPAINTDSMRSYLWALILSLMYLILAIVCICQQSDAATLFIACFSFGLSVLYLDVMPRLIRLFVGSLIKKGELSFLAVETTRLLLAILCSMLLFFLLANILSSEINDFACNFLTTFAIAMLLFQKLYQWFHMNASIKGNSAANAKK